MPLTFHSALLPIATLAAAPQQGPAATLFAEAEALKAKGDLKGAHARARQALAIVEATPRRSDAAWYDALEKMTSLTPSDDLEGQFRVYDQLVPAAERVKGADSYEVQAARSGLNTLALFLGKPGASLDAIAAPLACAGALARTEKERADTAALAVVLASFYNNAGQRAKAAETADIAARALAVMPAKPSDAWYGGVIELAKLHAMWGQIDLSLAEADRAIAGVIAAHGTKTVDAAPALIHRANALMRFQRFGEAEVAYREALALADVEQRTNDFLLASALHTLGKFYAATGREGLAVPLISRAADLAKAFPPGASSRFAALSDLYDIAMRRGDDRSALAYARAARDDLETRSFKGGGQQAGVLIQLASAATAGGEADEARTALDQAEAILAKSAKPGDMRFAELAMARGRLALREGERAQGIARLRAALTIAEAQAAPDQAWLATNRALLAQALLAEGDAAAGWTSGRSGADAMAGLIVTRSAQPSAVATVAAREAQVFDRAIDAAWAVRGRR